MTRVRVRASPRVVTSDSRGPAWCTITGLLGKKRQAGQSRCACPSWDVAAHVSGRTRHHGRQGQEPLWVYRGAKVSTFHPQSDATAGYAAFVTQPETRHWAEEQRLAKGAGTYQNHTGRKSCLFRDCGCGLRRDAPPRSVKKLPANVWPQAALRRLSLARLRT